MKINKLALYFAISIAAAKVASAAVSFTGAALGGNATVGTIPGGVNGGTAIYINANAGNITTPFSFSLAAGDNLTLSSTYGAGVSFLGSTLATNAFGRVPGISNIALDANVTTGDRFAIVTFLTSTVGSGAVAGDTYRVWTHPTWLIPTDTFSVGFFASPLPGDFQALLGSTQVPFFQGTVPTVVPEPSTYAAIAGFVVLGFVANRRRRSKA